MNDSNARSTKTRIETTKQLLNSRAKTRIEIKKYMQMFYSNARSTKTRIETCFFDSAICTRMQDPLKQGLRTQKYSNARSTKTRIETDREDIEFGFL
jgi:hypothetical protein